ncbi:ABC transporter substrate-binding protein [Diplocloster hominis]|uniref:ABC transporter substrate-binding protein n=1 Tax=Diplocloster hominis TaxID=3079010 RepID=UPI0031BA6E9F
MKRRAIAAILTAIMSASMVLAGCGQKAQSGEAAPKETSQPAANEVNQTPAGESKEKTTVKFYGKVIEYTSGPLMVEALQEKVKDKYNIDAIQVDWANLEKVIRTGLASGDPCDIYNYNPYDMATFADAAVDLTPYLDADPEWKAQIGEDKLKAATVDGKIVAIPWESNFTVIIGNKKLLDDAGVTVPEKWTYPEFKEACKKIKDTGVFPFANSSDLQHGEWLFRPAMLSETLNADTYDSYINHELSFKGEETKKVLTDIKSLYDEGYMYPGEGAVTVKSDELKAAFAQGKLAMMTDIGAGAKVTADELKASGIDAVIIPWPSVSDIPALNGAGNCFFVPKTSKNIDAAVDVIKAYTQTDIQSIHAQEGYIPVNKEVQISDEFVKTVVAQSETCVPDVVWPAEMNDYRLNSLIPDLILNGGVDAAIEKLEELRLSAQAGE